MNSEDLAFFLFLGLVGVFLVAVIFNFCRGALVEIKGNCDEHHALVLCPNDGEGWYLYPKTSWGIMCFFKNGRHRAKVQNKRVYGQGVPDLYSASIEISFLRGSEFVIQKWEVIAELSPNTTLSAIAGLLIKNNLLEKSLKERLHNFKQVNLEKLIANLTNSENQEEQESFSELIEGHFSGFLGETVGITGRFEVLCVSDAHLLEHLVRT